MKIARCENANSESFHLAERVSGAAAAAVPIWLFRGDRVPFSVTTITDLFDSAIVGCEHNLCPLSLVYHMGWVSNVCRPLATVLCTTVAWRCTFSLNFCHATSGPSSGSDANNLLGNWRGHQAAHAVYTA